MIYRFQCAACGAKVIARRTTGMPRKLCLACRTRIHDARAQSALVRMAAANPV